MNHSEKSQTCEEAELYYLSLAFGDEYGDVPKGVAAHVESCGYCRTQLKALREHLLTADTGDSENSHLSEAQTHILGLHFAYLGKEVGCEIVKPFLPSLLEPSLKARIPTPITVHLDRCELCRRDLAAIRHMNLTAKQLSTLNSILSDDLTVRNVDCSVAADSIQQYVNFDFRRIKPEVIKHLCCCSVCQSLLYKVRAENIRGLREENVQTGFPCESVTFADVFDYCFPYGLVPCSDQYASFREPFVNELKQCAKCLQKVQDLHQQVYAIKQRPESGIVTVYEIGEVPKSEVKSETESNYGGFPVNVRMLSPASRQIAVSTLQKHATIDRKPHIPKTVYSYMAKAAVAAGVILAVALFLRSIPTATAMTIQQVYDAVQKAVNVHIQQFAAESLDPLQEKWVSKDLGIYAVKDRNGFMIWDITNKVKHGKLTGSQQSEIVPLSEEQSAAIQKRIQGSLGIMPFENVLQVPRNAEWQELDSSALPQDITANVYVYELLWTKQSTDKSIVRFKWRGFIEEATSRPLRTEFYRYDTDSAGYELQTVHLIEYWTENQIKELLP